MTSILNKHRAAVVIAFLGLSLVSVRAGQTVVDAGTTFTFGVPAISTNYAWRLDGTLVSTNGIVGTNGPNFTYAPQRFDVGTHLLACYQMSSNGIASNTFWQVRARIPLPVSGTNFYVATNGLDSNAGTLAAPFFTLERARNAIRTNGIPAGGVTVYLRGGTYFRTNTFLLTNSDSGTMTSPVVYASYPGETAVISSGKSISAASFVPLNSSQTNRVPAGVNPTNILELDIASAGLTHFGSFPAHFGTFVTTNIYQSSGSGGIGELFYNGQRMWLSRYPNHDLTNDNLNTGFMLMDGVAATGPGSTNYLNGSGIYTNSAGVLVPVGGAFHYYPSNDTEVAKWTTALTNGGVWISGFWRVAWQNDAVQLLGMDFTNRVLEITNTTQVPNGLGSKYSRPQGSFSEPFWVMNLLEDLDQPGGWCVDFKRNKIYFYAPAPLINGNVVISDFGSAIVQLTQTTNVVFQSLIFEDGLAQGIYVTNGVNNLIVGCTLRNMNNYPVEFTAGYSNGIVSCLLQNLAGGGVFLRGGNETNSPRIPACDFVVNNIITNSGVVARIYSTPIDCGFGGEIGGGGGGGHTQCVGMRVAHNRIMTSPHVGILHGSWDNTFEYNDLGFDGQTCGGISIIYTYDSFGRCGNDNIRYNFIHDSAQCGALGFDNDHWGEHIYGNIANVTPAGLGVGNGTQTIAGHQQYADFYNNLTANNYQPYGGIAVVSPIPAVIEENASIFCSTPFPWSLVAIGSGSNTIANSSPAVMQSGPNITYTNDPGFLNFANEDFRLLPDAQLFTDMPKFAPIPFEMIGLYNDETWSSATGFSPYPTTAPATALGPGSATLNGALVYPQFDVNTTVFVCWGTNDGGTNLSAWTNVISFGVQGAGNFSTNLTGLARVPYFYRFYATNNFGQVFASSFATFTPYVMGHTPANLTWKGDGVTNVWDGNTNNFSWLNTNTPAPFWDGDTVSFTDSGTNSPPINLGATVQPAFVAVNAAKNYTLGGNGKISGITVLQKDGSGALTLLATNDYTGGTIINAGVLQVGNGPISGALGSGNLTNNATLIFNQSGDSTFAGTIYGSGELTKTNTGTLTLAASNFYSGTTTINGGGTVAIAADANLGAAGAGILLDNGTLQITSGGLFTLNNRTVALNSGGGTFNFANALIVTNAIIGSGPLTLIGAGTTILTASNSFAGTTTVANGLLQIDNGGGTGSVATNILLNGGDLLYARPDKFFQGGFISGSSTNSSISNLATSGELTLNFTGTSNVFGTVINFSSNMLMVAGGTNYFLPLGTDLRNSAANETLIVSNGYWFTPRIGANGGPYLLGTNIIANATLETSGARGVRGNFQIQNGGVLRLDSAHYPGAVNENRFDFGSIGMSSGETTSIAISSGGTLDIWTMQYNGFNLNPTTANTAAIVTQNGGTTLVGVNGSSNSVKNVVFNAAATNTLAEFLLGGGLLKVAGTISATAPGAGGTNLFLFSGGTLAVATFNTTNLFVVPSNSLVNSGGTLAPGDSGTPGAIFVQGNYVCSNAATALAIDIGGTNRANAFTNGANYYDFLGVSGSATLGGNLNVSLLNHFVPAATNGFTILTNNSGLSGAFANLIGGRVTVANYTGGSFLVVTSATSVVLTNFQVAATIPLVICGISLSGTNLIITGTNGSGESYRVLMATNLALPMTNWTSITTQQFGPGGAVNFTNPLNPNLPQSFYRLRLP